MCHFRKGTSNILAMYLILKIQLFKPLNNNFKCINIDHDLSKIYISHGLTWLSFNQSFVLNQKASLEALLPKESVYK